MMTLKFFTLKSHRIAASVMFLFSCTIGIAQNDYDDYVEKHSISIDQNAIPPATFDRENKRNYNVFFFGSVHGSQLSQEVDLQLLKHLAKYQNVRYYAPEVDITLASLLNRYLQTGNDSIIHYVTHHYQSRVPQDASVEFIEKWKKIYAWNSSLDTSKRILILGTDRLTSNRELRLKQIAFLNYKNGADKVLDSLRFFRHFRINASPAIHSGKPIMKSGKPYSYYFPNESVSFFDRFKTYYTESKSSINEAFGPDSVLLNQLLNYYPKTGRETAIYDNFKSYVIPKLDEEHKLYANYGYFHIQQSAINGQMSIAAKLKSDVPVTSIAGILYDSECLLSPDYKKTGEKLNTKGIILEKAEYTGDIKKRGGLDGDSFLQKLKGINHLSKHSRKQSSNILLLDLNKVNSPYQGSNHLSTFKLFRGRSKWRTNPEKSTTDFFQYVILMSNSDGNNSFQSIAK